MCINCGAIGQLDVGIQLCVCYPDIKWEKALIELPWIHWRIYDTLAANNNIPKSFTAALYKIIQKGQRGEE